MPDTPPPLIYNEMVDKARRAGTTVPEGTGEAMTWAPDPRGRVAYVNTCLALGAYLDSQVFPDQRRVA
jgi:hypothetical protein